MKKLSLVVAASFALLSFGAIAGETCIYGHDAKIAGSDNNDVLYDKDLVDPKLLALLKKQHDNPEKTAPLPTFN